jgi:O-antigen/teichoic acid export membrane protein
LADRLVPFLFGAGYGQTAAVLQILIWVVPLMFASEFLGYIVVVQGREGRVARAIMVSTGLNVLVNLLLVPRFGLFGAAVMTVVTEAVLVSQYLWILRSLLRSFRWGRVLVRPMLASLAMGMVALALRDISLAGTIGIAALGYAGLLFALGVLGRDEIHFVRGLRRPAATAQHATTG